MKVQPTGTRKLPRTHEDALAQRRVARLYHNFPRAPLHVTQTHHTRDFGIVLTY